MSKNSINYNYVFMLGMKLYLFPVMSIANLIYEVAYKQRLVT